MVVDALASQRIDDHLDQRYLRGTFEILLGAPAVQRPDLRLFDRTELRNAVLMTRQIAAESCSDWGVWPRANRAVFYGVSATDTYFGFLSETKNDTELRRILGIAATDVGERIRWFCGRMTDERDPVFQESSAVIRVLRKVAERRAPSVAGTCFSASRCRPPWPFRRSWQDPASPRTRSRSRSCTGAADSGSTCRSSSAPPSLRGEGSGSRRGEPETGPSGSPGEKWRPQGSASRDAAEPQPLGCFARTRVPEFPDRPELRHRAHAHPRRH
jgi:hypothetical protein